MHKLAIFFLAASSCLAQTFTITADHTNGIYGPGQIVHWRIRGSGEAVHYEVKSGGLKEIASGEARLTDGTAVVTTRFDGPGTLLASIRWGDGPSKRAVAGAVAAAGKLEPATNRPADFDAFWEAKITELEAIPAAPALESKPSHRDGVDYWEIVMNNVRGKKIRGQLARPHEGEKLPALLIVQWAGVYALDPTWVTDRAAAGWLALNIEAHDLPIDEPKSFYEAQYHGALSNYWNIGNDDRERSYFLPMYLSCYRAADYLAGRPDWNGRTLAVMGDSQGGLQTLMLAGLHPLITAAMALVPAGCDMAGPQAGRRGGWPQWYDNVGTNDAAKVHEASRYFDVVNFASRIKCPTLIGLGLIDEICPPAGVLMAANQIKAPKELVILPDSGHQNVHGSQAAYEERRDKVWLPALQIGRDPLLK